VDRSSEITKMGVFMPLDSFRMASPVLIVTTGLRPSAAGRA